MPLIKELVHVIELRSLHRCYVYDAYSRNNGDTGMIFEFHKPFPSEGAHGYRKIRFIQQVKKIFRVNKTSEHKWS